jgi:glycosyltransferase involved in cell wall biosynthesis
MTDPPVAGIAGALVAARRRCPLIYCIQDLYPDLVLAGELLRPGPWMRQWERWHRWALAQAERIVVLGDDIRERLLAKGLDGSRVVVVRTGAPAPTAPPIIERNVVHEIRGDFPFVVMYAGNLGHSGDWAALVEAAGLLESHGVGFVFIGDGALRGRAVALAARHPNVRFLPFRPAAQVSSVLAAADLHVVAVRDGLEGIVVPSKLYAILAAGKPVLAAAPEGSEVARIVRRHHCGLVVEPGAPPAVAAAVRTAMASPERLAAMAQRAMQAASTFDQARELETFARIVDEVIDQRHQGRGAQCAH